MLYTTLVGEGREKKKVDKKERRGEMEEEGKGKSTM
jgi:hypothetical protein